MAQDDLTLGQLWEFIQRDSATTRRHVQDELQEVRNRLDSFVTRDLWELEKQALERRIVLAEEDLTGVKRRHEQFREKIERDARAAAEQRSRDRRDFVYKGVIPVLALLIAAVSLYYGLT